MWWLKARVEVRACGALGEGSGEGFGGLIQVLFV